MLKNACFTVYKLQDLQEKIRCSDDFEIGTDKSVKRTKEVCEDRCTQDKSCQYYSYSNDNLCTLYAECKDDEKETHKNGTTFKRPSN